MNRGIVTAALAATVVLSAAAPAVAAPASVPPEVVDVELQGSAPGGQLWLQARGFAPTAPANVELVDSATDSVVATLPPITTNRFGVVLNPAGYRAPSDVPPGSYRLRVSQPTGATATWDDPLTVAKPSVYTYPDHLPGSGTTLYLTGFGGAPGIDRTASVDGRPLTLTPLVEGVHTDHWDDLTTATTLPTDLAVGSHTLTYTQASAPAGTVTTHVVIATPHLEVEGQPSWYPAVAGRQRVTVHGFSFGPGPVSVTAVTSDGRRLALPALDASGTSAVTLPGVAPGDLTFTATRAENGASASLKARVLPSTLTSPGSVDNVLDGNGVPAPAGQVRLSLDRVGQMSLSDATHTIWTSTNSDFNGTYTARLVVQPDGNLVTYSNGGGVLWASGTKTTDGPVTLSVLDEGRAVLTTAHGAVLWTTPTTALTTLPAGGSMAPGKRLYDDRYSFVVQGDGNVVLYRGSTPLWATRTAGNPGAVLKIQSDGNLVLYATNGRALWANHVKSATGSRLVLQPDGNLVEYTTSGKALWASGTAGR